eukprot:COSAG01_NODE_5308_length_4342_cov_29.521329_6_plen_30_part_00
MTGVTGVTGSRGRHTALNLLLWGTLYVNI